MCSDRLCRGCISLKSLLTKQSSTVIRRLGLLGTRWLVESEVYPQKLAAHGIGYLRPTDEESREINRIIMDELVYGVFRPESVTYHAARYPPHEG